MTAYWDKPDNLTLSPAYWRDPLPDVEAMLSSDLIAYYHSVIATPGMIDPFNPANLKPAAYELTLGPNCLRDGKEVTLTEEEPWLELPPNSIVFVSMRERLILPHYVVARFDLAIEFIYQGILLGTGPQVDPGFQGALSCPLHNISNASVHLQLGYPFAKIDFAKSRGLVAARSAGQLDKISTEDELYGAALTGENGEPVKLFNKDKRWRQPIYAPTYAGQKRVRSSLADLGGQIEKFASDISAFEVENTRLRRFGFAGAIAIVVAIVTVVVAVAQLDRSYTDAKLDSITTTTTSTTTLAENAAVARLEREVEVLQRQVARLRARLPRPSP